MAKWRTRKDKIIAQLRRQAREQSSKRTSASSRTRSSSRDQFLAQQRKTLRSDSSQTDFLSLFSYDPRLIRKDLVRTAIWASMAFSVEIGLYFFLR
ncbi:hypothetical protein IH980_00890 [Patescibacteria group bacterium]|nr:hypothetical protein [Patescibacteria group bacterium]